MNLSENHMFGIFSVENEMLLFLNEYFEFRYLMLWFQCFCASLFNSWPQSLKKKSSAA